MTRQALGRGLSALLKDQDLASENEALDVGLDLLEPNPYQPRQLFSDAKLEELAQSIRVHGFIQPLVVRRNGERYQIIAGERRWRAAQRLGMLKVPVLVRQISDERLLEVSLIENIQRENLNPIEEARAYHRLAQEFGLTQEQIAQQTGKERSTVANFLRLLKLPQEIQLLVMEEKLSMGHARALLTLESFKQQGLLAGRIIRNGWSVRQTEKAVTSLKSESPEKLGSKPADPNVKAAIERMEHVLGTKVRVVEKGSRGRIEIEYYSHEELQRLYEHLIGEK